MLRPVLRCTLSGSYHKDREGLQNIYEELITSGCQVLSPHRLEFDSEATVFVRDKAEHHLSEVDIEEHHLLSIRQSNFLWIHAPEGYIGASAAFEIGYAVANGLPIFSLSEIEDTTLKHYVRTIPSVFSATKTL